MFAQFCLVIAEADHLGHTAPEKEGAETDLVARTGEGDPRHPEDEGEEAKLLLRAKGISSHSQLARRKTGRMDSFRNSMFWVQCCLFSFLYQFDRETI